MFSHIERRKEILKNHPEVSSLFVKDTAGGYRSLAAAALQTAACVLFSSASWLVYTGATYFLTATTAQYLFLSNHELSHGMYSESPTENRLISIAANGPIVIPYAISFRDYHLAHHRLLGVTGKDMDLPSEFEKKVVGNSTVRKAIWLTFQIIAYAIRPVIIDPHKITFYHILNILYQMLYVFLIVFYFGWAPIRMMLLSVVVAGGLHPTAGHFISEHFTNQKEQETFSYYGPLNMVTLNVGYHCEHHDFQQVPGKYLPKLKKMAPEFYDNLEYHDSWSGLLFKFVFDSNMSLGSRVKNKYQ